ncbi:TIGR00725 family protein [Halobacteria archaeon HArc-gm2]|nr:TIGR00725 family protein [Halobacteria archaeon HArc-gm2]
MRVAVIGGGTVDDAAAELAREVGKLLGKRDHTVVCGGLGGVMEAACEGAKREDGETIGILPTERQADANEFVDTAIATGLGHGRNHLVVLNGDAVIAIDGGSGTLSEIGFAGVYDRPIAGLGTHQIDGLDHVIHCETPKEAVDYVESKV